MTARVDDETFHAFKVKCAEARRTQADVMIELVKSYLGATPAAAPATKRSPRATVPDFSETEF